MTRVHAFSADDALTDLDATGLVEALRSGLVSVPEVVEAAIARTEQVDAALGAVAYAAYDRAREEARHPRGGWFAGVPDLRQGQRRRRRHADPARLRRVQRPAAGGRRRLRPDVPRHRAHPARQDAALGVRLLRRRRPRAPRAGPLPVEPRPLRRRLVRGLRRPRRRRCGADRARQRRRRLDPDPRRGQRARGPQAHPRSPGPGPDDARHAGADRLRRRPDPQRPRHRRVLPRGREGLAQPAPRARRRRHPPEPGPAPHRGRHRGDRPLVQPRGARADAAHGRAARAARPPRRGGRQPGAGQLPRALRPLLVDARAGHRPPGQEGLRRPPGTRPSSTT